MRHRVVSFDGDNTLWDFDAALRQALGQVLAHIDQLCATGHSLDVERLLAIRQEVGDELGEEPVSLSMLRKEALRRSAVEAGLDASSVLVEELFQTFMSARDAALQPFDDVPETLTELKSDGWIVALLTNGNANPASTGIADRLDHLLYAEQIGVGKPHRGAFEAVSKATGCSLNDLVHVGDSLDNDVGGALNAGATAVWLNRERVKRNVDIEPHHEISTLAALPEILRGI